MLIFELFKSQAAGVFQSIAVFPFGIIENWIMGNFHWSDFGVNAHEWCDICFKQYAHVEANKVKVEIRKSFLISAPIVFIPCILTHWHPLVDPGGGGGAMGMPLGPWQMVIYPKCIVFMYLILKMVVPPPPPSKGGIPIDRGSDRPIIEKGPIDRLLKRVL